MDPLLRRKDFDDLSRAYKQALDRKHFLEDQCAQLQREVSEWKYRYYTLLENSVPLQCPPGFTMVAADTILGDY